MGDLLILSDDLLILSSDLLIASEGLFNKLCQKSDSAA